MSEEKKEELSLEETFEKLEKVISDMEQEDVSLEKSFSLYEEGVHLLSSCNEKIDMIEKKVAKLSEDGTLVDFEEE